MTTAESHALQDRAQASVEALEASGAANFDMLRFHYLKAFQRLALKLPPSMARRLQQRIVSQAESLATRMAQRNARTLNKDAPEPEGHRPPQRSPLAALIQHLHDLNHDTEDQATTPSATQSAPELKSVRRFRESLRRRQSEKAVARAVAERPENPGPLNPQMLMIRSLALLRDLSPAYVNRFVTYAESLLWLEDTQTTEEPAKALRPAPTQKRR